jgi:hypothetical protein
MRAPNSLLEQGKLFDQLSDPQMAYWQSGQFCHGLSKLRIFRLALA